MQYQAARQNGAGTHPDGVAQPEAISDYWDDRSKTYSNGIVAELESPLAAQWRAVLEGCLGASSASSACGAKVLDVGCGPGFFTVILTGIGCEVVAVDFSEGMLDFARRNVEDHGDPSKASFAMRDVSDTGFDDASFDLVVMRNVTWLMKDPRRAYAEWARILKPEGKLVFFDANWYRYLVDDETAASRMRDLERGRAFEIDANATASAAQERRCERIALGLPLTYELRPAWDVAALKEAGFRSVRVDEGIGERVWGRREQVLYASSPLFMVEATR